MINLFFIKKYIVNLFIAIKNMVDFLKIVSLWGKVTAKKCDIGEGERG